MDGRRAQPRGSSVCSSPASKGTAVQYFYEPFLEAVDPDLRRQLGVWYTPPEVVEYMVACVSRCASTERRTEFSNTAIVPAEWSVYGPACSNLHRLA